MRGRTIRSASVIGSADWFTPLLVLTLLPLVIMLVAVIYLTVKYTPVIGRIFQAQPFFMPVKVQPSEHGESVEFMTEDGLRLCGTYLRSRTSEQAGVLVYCHEYLSDRWSFHPYLDQFRDLGFDLFTFDFRNHGESDLDPEYAAMQWTTDHETRDLRAALAYLRSRHDHDPAGFGLFGVSRGGTTALIVAASEPDVWGVITDGAFPTQGTVVSYILRWAQIFVPSPVLRGLIPLWLFNFLAWTGQRWTERVLGCRFPNVEASVIRLAPRPWLMIHGMRDTYIGPDIARSLFAYAKSPKEQWLVPDAKHNRCRETDPENYAARLLTFFEQFAPRRPFAAAAEVVSRHRGLAADFGHALAPSALTREMVTPVSG
jgi:pimeloyl-ACP methyl ester carboxylesterase